jgi:hypothetical protein
VTIAATGLCNWVGAGTDNVKDAEWSSQDAFNKRSPKPHKSKLSTGSKLLI